MFKKFITFLCSIYRLVLKKTLCYLLPSGQKISNLSDCILKRYTTKLNIKIGINNKLEFNTVRKKITYSFILQMIKNFKFVLSQNYNMLKNIEKCRKKYSFFL